MRSQATRAASSRAASRRGWRTTTWPLPSRPRSSSICGTWVDLPEPVGAETISRRAFSEPGHEGLFDFIDWQSFRHEGAILNRMVWTLKGAEQGAGP